MRIAALASMLAIATAACSAERTLAPDPELSKGLQSTHALDLTAGPGPGSGRVNITPTAEENGRLHVQGEVTLRGVLPFTTYFIQRAPDPNAETPEVCSGPWLTFPFGTPGQAPATVTTNAQGNGSGHVDFGVPPTSPYTSGLSFTVRFRAIDDVAAPTSVLTSECVTVLIK